MLQDQDTCRICSGPGEDEQPLFYPCKCSGTIRYIHQDCLKTWLDHSKKTTCDVCKHPYAFTKVYAPDMPERVPVTILVRKFAEQVANVILFMLRATLVAFVWLILLPYGTVLTWRLYFRMGDVLAWSISIHPRSDSLNTTAHAVHNRPTSATLQKQLSDVSFQPYLRTISTDIFTGQIIASLIVLAFLAVFLLREWIQQNALPGVFDDAPAGEAPAQMEPQPQEEGDQMDIDHNRRVDADAQWAPDAPVRELDPAPRAVPDVPEDVRPAGPASSSSSSSSDTDDPPNRPASATGVDQPLPTFGRRRRVKIYEVSRKRAHRATAGPMANQNSVRRRRRILKGEGSSLDAIVLSETQSTEEAEFGQWDVQDTEPPGPRRHSGLYALEGGPTSRRYTVEQSGSGSNDMSGVGSKSGQKRKAEDSENERENGHHAASVERSLSPQSPGFEFTFHLPQSSRDRPSTFLPTFALPENGEFKLNLSSSRSMVPSLSSVDASHTASGSAEPSSSNYTSNPGPQVFELPPPSEVGNRGTLAELPYPLTPRTSAPSSTSQLPFSEPPDDASPSASTFQFTFTPSPLSTPSQLLRRPPLPTSTVHPVEHVNAEASSSTAGTYATTALPSPHLATYRPPEELEVDKGEYFGEAHAHLPRQDAEDEEEEDEDEAHFEYYFREPDPEDAKEMPPPLLLPDTDEDDDDEDAHDAEEPREARPQVDEDEPPAGRDAPGLEADAELAEEERDQNLEEDLDGAMEAVGLRGPIFSVFQNAALMLFILNVSIGGGVWVPFTLGKTISLLTLEPRRAIQLLHLPIRAVRLVTDPSVDGVIYALRFASISLLMRGRSICLWMLHLIGLVFGETVQEGLLRLGRRIDHQILAFFTNTGDQNTLTSPVNRSISWNISGEQILSYARSVIHRGDPALSSFAISVSKGSSFQFAEERFAILGQHVRLALAAAWKRWVGIAEGDGTVERLSAIFLGYAIAAFLAALYLNTFTVGNVKSAGRAVRNAIRQQMIVLKVALFIVVELVMFPFGCGTMLDFSTLALFPEATVEARLAFFTNAPITAAFYHWLIGTMFMYQFAILLATCRDILRPGCMWFIKDPQDPTFHPIRDILDRPTLAQLRKLCMSAIMYAFVITFGVGCIVWSLTAMTPSILPLRWKMREPLSEIPVDLLFVHLILPPTLHYFRPRKTVRRLMTAWWQWTAWQLRLTSFMFGGRHPHEEYTPTQWSWRSLFLDNEESLETDRDGSFRRVPAGDNIAFLRDRPALVQVDEHGMALDEGGRAIMWAQNAEAQQAGRNYRDDYLIVYVPPHFRRRIFSFIALFWLCGSVAMMSAVFVPILLGRAVFSIFSSRPFHDGYSFTVGFYLLWWSWLVGILMVRIRIRRQRHEGSRRIRAGWVLFLFKRVFVYFTKIMWMVLWLGIVLPTLVSITVDLYIVIPFRFFIDPNFTPTLHIVESWATGLILSKIIIRTQRTRPGTDLTGALEAIQRNGWRRPDPLAATRDFIVPIGTGLVAMILLPPLLLYACCKISTPPWQMEDIFRLVYPSIFVAVATFQFAMSLVGVFAKWTQGIRDKEFLVELRLRNLENPRKTAKAESTEDMPAGKRDAEKYEEETN